MLQLKALIEEDLPSEVRQSLIFLYIEELAELTTVDDQKETSLILQKKCTLLFLLACLAMNDANLSRQLLD